MKTVNIHAAKTHLSRLIEEVRDGEQIVIAKAGTPRARLVPIAAPKVKRKPGIWKGRLWVASDFDDPLPPDILSGFMGGEP